MKPQNIPKLVELGSHDIGFTGRDWVVETDSDVHEVMDFGFDPVRIVVAIPEHLDPNNCVSSGLWWLRSMPALPRHILKNEGIITCCSKPLGRPKSFHRMMLT